jgi:hypothetical protein
VKYGQPQGPTTPVIIELRPVVSRLGRLVPIRLKWFSG